MPPIEETFAQLYCREIGIKPAYCKATFLKASSTIKIDYRVDGEKCQSITIEMRQALDMLSRRLLRLEEKQVTG